MTIHIWLLHLHTVTSQLPAPHTVPLQAAAEAAEAAAHFPLSLSSQIDSPKPIKSFGTVMRAFQASPQDR